MMILQKVEWFKMVLRFLDYELFNYLSWILQIIIMQLDTIAFLNSQVQQTDDIIVLFSVPTQSAPLPTLRFPRGFLLWLKLECGIPYCEKKQYMQSKYASTVHRSWRETSLFKVKNVIFTAFRYHNTVPVPPKPICHLHHPVLENISATTRSFWIILVS